MSAHHNAHSGSAEEPLVTVLMPVYNAGAFLRPAVASALAQTHAPLELLLVDDGSADGAVDEVIADQDPRVRVIRQENAGKSAALNVGIAAARGGYIAMLDADDLCAPTRVERQLRLLMERPELAAVFCGYELIMGERRLAPQARAKDAAACRRDIEAYRMPAHDPTGMYRRSMIEGLRYDEDLTIGEGLDYILRLGEQRPLAVAGECLYSYRVHGGSITRCDPAWRAGQVRMVIERAAARRGVAAPPRKAPRSPSRRPTNKERDNNLAGHFLASVQDQTAAGRRFAACATGLACARLHPFDPYYWRAMALALFPRASRSRRADRAADQEPEREAGRAREVTAKA